MRLGRAWRAPIAPVTLVIRVAIFLFACWAGVAGLTIRSPGAQYNTISEIDGGVIKGTVVYAGPPPVKKKIIVTKDQEVCGSGIREIDQIRLGPNNVVGEAVIYLREAIKAKAWDTPERRPTIENKNCDFRPHVQVIAIGDLDIVNSDPVLHNTHGFLDKRTVFNVALPYQGLRIEKPLREPGLVRVECDAHGWMRGWVYVAGNPYYGITGHDGTFALPNVPPGSYTLVAWHEYTGVTETKVVVRAEETVSVTVKLKK